MPRPFAHLGIVLRTTLALAAIAGCAAIDLDGSDEGTARISDDADGGDTGDAGDGAAAEPEAVGAQGLVIRQLYVAGGEEGSTFPQDYIEVFNASSAGRSLAGLSLQVAGGPHAFKTTAEDSTIKKGVIPLPERTIPRGRSYLISIGAAPETDGGLPADLAWTRSNLPRKGKLAIVRATDAGAHEPLGCGTADNRCDSDRVIDLVGWGEGTSDHEGSAPAGETAPDTAIHRRSDGCLDSNDNAADFFTGPPKPRWSNDPLPTIQCSADGGAIDAGAYQEEGEEQDAWAPLPDRDAAPRAPRARDAGGTDASAGNAASPGASDPQPTCSLGAPSVPVGASLPLLALVAAGFAFRRRSPVIEEREP